LLQKLNEINITPYLFNEVLSPAFGDVAAYAKEVRSQMENDDVWDTYNPDGGAANPDPEEDGVYVKRIRCLSNGSLTILEGIFTVLKFIFDPDHRYANDYQLVLMKTMNRTNANTSRRRKKNAELPDPPPKTWIHKLAFWCLNPAVIFRDMAKNTRSVILTSGTLSPVSDILSFEIE
jgi:Fanconi anemia group J protein